MNQNKAIGVLSVSVPTHHKFGQVYLERDIVDPSTLCHLKDVHFSNVDLKWYNSEGQLHPEYEHHVGKSFHYEFSMICSDMNGNPVDFHGMLTPCFKLGHLPATTLEELQWADQSCLDWSINECKLYAADDSKRIAKFEKISTGALATLLSLGLPRAARSMLMTFIPAIYYVDEILLELQPLTYLRAHRIATACSDVLRGTRTWDDNSDRNCPELIRPYFYATKVLRDIALQCVTEEEAEPLFAEYSKHLYSFAIENCVEWKGLETADPALFAAGQPNVRLLNSGAKIVIEMVLVNCGIVIGKKIRESFLFRHFYSMYEKQATIVNDLFSYQREFDNGESCNHVYILHVVKGIPLDKALEQTLEQVNLLTIQICKLGELLAEQFAAQPEVGMFVEVAKRILEGHYQFYTYAHRENLKFSFNCVVEDE